MNDYVIGYDKGIKKDRSSLIISKYNNSTLYVLAEFYDEKADLINEIITNLQQENQQLKEENARLKLKPLEGVFAQVDDDMLLRSCGAMQQEIDNYKYILAELEKDLWAVRRLTFTKYYSNEWNNCLSFNEDNLPIINKIQKLKEKNK